MTSHKLPDDTADGNSANESEEIKIDLKDFETLDTPISSPTKSHPAGITGKRISKNRSSRKRQKAEAARRNRARDVKTKAALIEVAEKLKQHGKMSSEEIQKICDLNDDDWQTVLEDVKIFTDKRHDSERKSKQSLRLSERRSKRSPRLSRGRLGDEDSLLDAMSSQTRKSTMCYTDKTPMLYEYAMVFQIGDESVQAVFNDDESKKDFTLNQFEHYANKTFQLLNQLGTGNDIEDDSDGESKHEDYTIGAGFCYEVYRSRSKVNPEASVESKSSEYLIALIGLVEDDFKSWASCQRTDLLLDPRACIERGREIKFPLARITVLPEELKKGEMGIDFKNWNYCYAEYISLEAKECLYQKHKINPDAPDKVSKEDLSVFPKKTRLRLLYEKLVAEEDIGGANIPIERLIHDPNHPLIAVFPMHTSSHRSWLDENWLKKWDLHSLLHPPINDIRDYFNEPIAFYFSFMESYLRWLIPLSLFGTAWFVLQLTQSRSSFTGMEVFIVFVIIWSVCFVDFWKRRQSTLCVRWGMHNFSRKEVARPLFLGQWTVDDTTGLPIESFPSEWSYLKLFGGFTGLFFLISSVLVAISLIIALRNLMTLNNGDPVCYPSSDTYPDCTEYQCTDGTTQADCTNNGGDVRDLQIYWLMMVGGINAIQIFIFNTIFTKVSKFLNEWENHKTQAAFDDSMVIKSFAFKFVNAFGSLYYIAFIAKYYDQSSDYSNDRVISLLQFQLLSLFGVALIIQNLQEVLIPVLLRWIVKYRSRNEEVDGEVVSPVEEQLELGVYTNTLEDMSEIVIQYGYVTLFLICLPIVPLFAFLNNIVEVKVDGIKLVRYSRRPQPFGAQGLGSWISVLEFLSVISVLTNVALFTFVTDQVEEYFHQYDLDEVEHQKLKFFFVACASLLVVVGAFKSLIKDVPDSVGRHLRRQEYIEDVLIKGQEFSKEKLEMINRIEKEIKKRVETERKCCCGMFRVRPQDSICCGKIPWFSLSEKEELEMWIAPKTRGGDKPVEQLDPKNMQNYKEVLDMYELDLEVLPDGNRDMIVADRPHRVTHISDTVEVNIEL